ncbi:MAG: hypothetical protein GXO55_11330 [Chloroflexi bacterium]|nr:hypothetical protein [Chloroflexota bacterium]
MSHFRRALYRYSALGILLVAFVLRVWQLDAQSIWHDEGLSWWFARQPLTQLLHGVMGTEHPPLYFLALGLWMRVAGDSAYALRFFSVIGGVLSIALLIRLARHWRYTAAGLLAALFWAWNPFHIWYSQEVRSYAWLPLLALILTALGQRWHQTRSFRTGVLYGLTAGFALYVHPFLVLLLIPQAILLLLLWHGPPATRARALTPFLLALLLFLPWVFPTLGQAQTNRTYWYWGFLDVPKAIVHTAQAFAYYPLPAPLRPSYLAPLTLFMWILALVGTLLVLPKQEGKWWATATWVPLLLTLTLAYFMPKYAARYVIYAQPFWLLFVAIALLAPLNALRQHQEVPLACAAGTLLTLVVVGYGITSWDVRERTGHPQAARPNFRDPILFLHNKAQPGDAIILEGGYIEPTVRYYLRREDVTLVPLPPGLLLDLSHPLQWRDVAPVLNRITHQTPRVWTVLWQEDLVDPQQLVYTLLTTRGCALLLPGLTPQVDVGLYLVPRPLNLAPEPAPRRPVHVTFDNGLVLEGFDAARVFDPHTAPDVCLQDREHPSQDVVVAAGEMLYVTLTLRPQRPISDALIGFVHLVNREGNRAFALDDRPLGAQAYPIWRWKVGEPVAQTFRLSIPRDLPPGEYALEIGLYHPQTLQRVSPLPHEEPHVRVDGSRILYSPVHVIRP